MRLIIKNTIKLINKTAPTGTAIAIINVVLLVALEEDEPGFFTSELLVEPVVLIVPVVLVVPIGPVVPVVFVASVVLVVLVPVVVPILLEEEEEELEEVVVVAQVVPFPPQIPQLSLTFILQGARF